MDPCGPGYRGRAGFPLCLSPGKGKVCSGRRVDECIATGTFLSGPGAMRVPSFPYGIDSAPCSRSLWVGSLRAVPSSGAQQGLHREHGRGCFHLLPASKSNPNPCLKASWWGQVCKLLDFSVCQHLLLRSESFTFYKCNLG